MITRVTNNAKTLYITFCDDIGVNNGGYYCQVYENELMDNEIDNFVIPAGADIDEVVNNYINNFAR